MKNDNCQDQIHPPAKAGSLLWKQDNTLFGHR